MLPIVKRNDSWVLAFNILCALAFYFLTCEPAGRFSAISFAFIFVVLSQGVFVNVFLERFALLPQKSHVPQFIQPSAHGRYFIYDDFLQRIDSLCFAADSLVFIVDL